MAARLSLDPRSAEDLCCIVAIPRGRVNFGGSAANVPLACPSRKRRASGTQVLPIGAVICSQTDEALVDEADREGFVVGATVPAKGPLMGSEKRSEITGELFAFWPG